MSRFYFQYKQATVLSAHYEWNEKKKTTDDGMVLKMTCGTVHWRDYTFNMYK